MTVVAHRATAALEGSTGRQEGAGPTLTRPRMAGSGSGCRAPRRWTPSGTSAALGTMLLAVLLMAGTPLMIAVAGAPAATIAFVRCAVAAAVLGPLALAERRRRGPLPARAAVLAVLAGAFLGADFVMFNQSVFVVGAGVATVLLTVQVVVAPLLSRAFRGVPVPGRFWAAVPVVVVGIVLVTGVQEVSVTPDPVGVLLGLGAGVMYGCYLFVLRESSGYAGRRLVVAPVAWATLGAAGSSGAFGLITGGIDLTQSPRTWAWLLALALCGQVLAWLLVNRSAQVLPPTTVATLLVGQPMLAVLAAVLLLGEPFTALQGLGCLLTVVAVMVVTYPGRATARAAPAGASTTGEPAPEEGQPVVETTQSASTGAPSRSA